MNYLPSEDICAIISHTSSIQDIVNYMLTSKYFYNLSKACVIKITSDRILQIPITYFKDFSRLRTIDENIFIVINNLEEVSIAFTLSYLYSANFLIFDENIIIDAIALLLKNLNFVGKLPNVNFKILTLRNNLIYGIILQGYNYMIIGYDVKPNPFASYNYTKDISYDYIIHRPMIVEISNDPYEKSSDKFVRTIVPFISNIDDRLILYSGSDVMWKILNYYQLLSPDRVRGINDNNKYLLKQSMREFIYYTDFGLVNPEQPPDPNINPPLSRYLQKLADVSIVRYLDNILFIYFCYNKLIKYDEEGNYIFIADNAIKSVFKSIIQLYVNYAYEEDKVRWNIDLNSILEIQLDILSEMGEYVLAEPIQLINEYNIPIEDITDEQLNYIENTVGNTKVKYDDLYDLAKTTSGMKFYRTDGSLEIIL